MEFIFNNFGSIIGFWILGCIYILIGIVIAISNENKWHNKKYEALIKLLFVIFWPIVILGFPIWLLYRFISVSTENQKRRNK